MFWLLLLLLLVLWLAVIPAWPYSRGWGYYPFGGVTAILAIVLFLWWFGIIALTV